MKNVKAFSTIFILVLSISTSASIINIPEDYTTIQEGINASSDGDTVLVQSGTYYENINFFGRNITVSSLLLTTSDPYYLDSTIIDVSYYGTVVEFSNGEGLTAILYGFTIQRGSAPNGGGIYIENSSPTISANKITENAANFNGGGIYCSGLSSPNIDNNTIVVNGALNQGGGIMCYESTPIISGNIIKNNSSVSNGGGICCDEDASPYIYNNTISENYAYQGGGILASGDAPVIEYNVISNNNASTYAGGISTDAPNSTIRFNLIIYNQSTLVAGGILCVDSSPLIENNTIYGNRAGSMGGGIYNYYASPIIKNTILWADSANSEANEIDDSLSTPSISYCCIEGGYEGEGNIDSDPLFIDPNNGDYNLMAGSPCIDAGDPDSPLDPDSTRVDIGAFYYDQTVAVDDIVSLPMEFNLSQNYPNPFNASTVISYILPEPAQISLTIYDILGRQVIVPIDGKQNAGEHRITWKAADYPSGVYFARLKYLDRSESIKMLMVK